MADRWNERDRDQYRHAPDDRDRYDRGMTDRAGDEVRSWFGDEDAARRRRLDEMRDDRYDRDWSDRPMSRAGRGWERAQSWTDRDRDGRRGLSEWNDSDRPWDRAGSYERERWSSGRPESETRWRDRGDYGRYGTAYSMAERSGGSDYSTGTAAYGTATYGTRDWRTPNYAGRGPRGYQRGEERIREEVCDRLTDDPRIDASDIEVQVKGGDVVLEGSVRSRDEKRFTEDLVERITGVRDVHNHLKVRPADEVIGTARSGASTLGLTNTPPPTPPTRQTK